MDDSRQKVIRVEAALVAGAGSPLSFTGAQRDPAALYLCNLSSPRSRRVMGYKLAQIARWFGHDDPRSFPWHELRYEHAVALRTYMGDRSYAPASINAALCALAGVARQAWLLGLSSGDDYQRLLSVKRAAGQRLPPGRALSVEELASLFASCARDPQRERGARDAGLVALLVGSGVRCFEASALDLARYRPQSGELRVLGKGDRERRIYVSDGARAALADWLAVRGIAPGPLIARLDGRGLVMRPLRRVAEGGIARALAARAARAGVARFSPHDCRRTFITRTLESSEDLLSVQSLAGHKDPKTTETYDRRGEQAKQRASAAFDVPYRGTALPPARRRG